MNKVPGNLDEAIDWILNNVEGIKKPLENLAERKFVVLSHMSYGMWIRNNWGFWKEDTELYFWFLTLGIRHPDDMSSILITSTYRKFHGKNPDIAGQVQHYKDFWKSQNK